MTIGRYQRTNQPIPIIAKTADNQLIPIIGAFLITMLQMDKTSEHIYENNVHSAKIYI